MKSNQDLDREDSTEDELTREEKFEIMEESSERELRLTKESGQTNSRNEKKNHQIKSSYTMEGSTQKPRRTDFRGGERGPARSQTCEDRTEKYCRIPVLMSTVGVSVPLERVQENRTNNSLSRGKG